MATIRSLAAGLLLIVATQATAQTLRPDQLAFRELYKELVETNTTLSAGSCTLAAERMAARLKAAGFPDADLTLFATPENPKEGGLVARLAGRDSKARPMLLLAHIDVVEANRADWTRDPFTLIEEGGYFYARGAADDKSQAAIWTDSLIRIKRDGYRPRRTIKMALTCGEETTHAFNGAEWLANNRRDLIDAEFAINEGGGGRLGKDGKRELLSMQIGEKAAQNYLLEVTNPGGHSSRPMRPNAINQLAVALAKVDALEFPVEFNPVTREFFGRLSKSVGGETGAAMAALLADAGNAAADAIVSRDPSFHSMLRTTCVATLASAGHANNALPQRATANINCRIFPGTSVEAVQTALVSAINDWAVSVTAIPPLRPTPGSPPLTKAILEPAEKLAAKMFPGTPILPTMSTGATDGIFLFSKGIPTYGVPGIFGDADGNGAHGLNERIRVRSLYEGRDYLYELVKLYAESR